jgi:hypothetical protein
VFGAMTMLLRLNLFTRSRTSCARERGTHDSSIGGVDNDEILDAD